MLFKNKLYKRKHKVALARVIAPQAFWSYAKIDPSKISSESLIEAVLLYGNDPLKSRLFALFSKNLIKKVWEQRLVIQDSRLHSLNRKIASKFLNLNNPENHIQLAYKKYNLYDRFSA
jgi:hypothetical protein